MKKELLALNMRNLQFFADGSEAGADDNGGAGTEGNESNNNGNDNGQEFKGPQSQSELDSLTNKAVQKALENYKKGEQERIKQRIAEALEGDKVIKKESQPIPCFRGGLTIEEQIGIFGTYNLDSFKLHLQGHYDGFSEVIYNGKKRKIQGKNYHKNSTVIYI